MEFHAEDRANRWIYRAIYPAEARNDAHRLIQDLDAEADWNFGSHCQLGPPTMWQRRTSAGIPMGLSFFSFANDHFDAVVVADLPTQAEMGHVLAVIVENSPSIASSIAYKEIVTKRSQPKKIRDATGQEVTLKVFVCYKADGERLTKEEGPFCCNYDDVPPNHGTVAPAAHARIECKECTIGGKLGAEPTQPTLFELLDFRMHCFRMRAAAEPRPLSLGFNSDVHRLARVFYRGFDTDCSEEDSKSIVDVLRFLDQLDYRLSALKLLKKERIIELLNAMFSSEYIDEEETKEVVAILQWMQNDCDKQMVSEHELTGTHPTRLQVAVRYDVPISNDALDSICHSYENHFMSDAHSVVPRYTLLASASHQVVVEFACDYVPVHLFDFPAVELCGRRVHPADFTIIIIMKYEVIN